MASSRDSDQSHAQVAPGSPRIFAIPCPPAPRCRPSSPPPTPAPAKRPRGRPKGSGLGKKHTRRRKESFGIYIVKLLGTVHPGLKMSSRSVRALDSFCVDMLEYLASEAGRLAVFNKRSTLRIPEVKGACELLIPGELGKMAVKEGQKAADRFKASAKK